MGTDLRPGVLTGVLYLLAVVDPKLGSGRHGTLLLALGIRGLTVRELVEELSDRGTALGRDNTQPVTNFLTRLDTRRPAHTLGSTVGRTPVQALPQKTRRGHSVRPAPGTPVRGVRSDVGMGPARGDAGPGGRESGYIVDGVTDHELILIVHLRLWTALLDPRPGSKLSVVNEVLPPRTAGWRWSAAQG